MKLPTIRELFAFDLSTFAQVLRASNRVPVSVRCRRAARAAGLCGGARWLSTDVAIPRPRRDAFGWVRAAGRIRSLRANVVGGGLVLVSLLAICLGVGSQLTLREKSPLESLADGVLTVAEVTGGVAGLLLAVVVFGVELLATRLKRIGFLVPYLVRRDGLLPITAFVLAVIAANVLAGLTSTLLEWPGIAVIMATLDLVLLPIVLSLTLRLLFHTVTSISAESLLPALREAHASHLDGEMRNALVQRALRTQLASASIEFGPYHGVFEPPGRRWRAVPILGLGVVYDVRLDVLEELVDVLRARAGASDFKLGFGIGDEVRSSTALWFETDAATGEPSSDLRMAMDRLSRRLVRTRSAGDREFPELVKRMVDKLVHIARHDDVDEFEQALDTVVGLIRQRIVHPISGATEADSPTLSGLPGYLSDVQWFHIGDAVAQTADPARVKALFSAAKAVLLDAAEHRRAATMRVFGQVIESVYGSVSRGGNAALAEDIGRQIDGDLDVVLVVGGARPLGGWGEPITPDRIRQVTAVHAAWVGWVLGLVRTALAAGRPDDAANFANRLRRVRAETEQRPEAGVMPEMDALIDLLTLADVYFIGWCVREIDRDEPSEAARTLLERLLDDDDETGLPTRERLLRAWEHFPSADDGAGLLHASVWDRDEAMRTGIAYTSSGPTWPTRGLYAALLAAESEPRFHADRVMTPVPRSKPPDDPSTRAHLTALATRPHVRAALIEEDEDAPEAVSHLFAERRRAYRLDELRRVVAALISDPVLERLRVEAEIAALREPSIVQAILKLGVRDAADGCVELPATNLGGDYPKGLFVEQNSTSYVRFGDAIGVGLATRRQQLLLFEIEQRATSVNTARSEADLPMMLQAAVTRLRADGFEPNAVIVPYQERLLRMLVAGPDWRRRQHREWGPDHVGTWQGLAVFRCPYEDTAAAVVFDTRRLFGRAPRVGVRLTIVEHDAAAHVAMLRAGEAAAEETIVPVADAVRVRTRAALDGPLVMCDARAVAKVSIDLGRLGYVMPSDSPHYHRPGCSDAVGPRTSLSSIDPATGTRRTPCPTCRPDEWDDLLETADP